MKLPLILILFLTTAAFPSLFAATPPTLLRFDATSWPTAAAHQTMDRVSIDDVGPTGIIDCTDPCTDDDCEEWTYYGGKVCRPVAGDFDCQQAVNQYCMKRDLQSGFHECKTCVN